MAMERSARPVARCLRCTRHNRITSRSISATPWRAQGDTTTEPPSSAVPPPPPSPAETASSKQKPPIDPETITNPRQERKLIRDQNQFPIGSRRRRAALASSKSDSRVPFEQLPYQCFQEARKVLQDDRAEKVAEIEEIREKIAKAKAEDVPPEREALREKRVRTWEREMARLKILADVNDPLVKKRFEDGNGDMNKPIYRHLADLKWRSLKRQILMQRITQMNVVPDILPAIDPTVSTALKFNGTKVHHGDLALSATTEKPPLIEIQTYEKGEKLVTIAVVTPDVPNVEKDGFDYRCHFLAVNVRITPTEGLVHLGRLKEGQVVQGWLPPYAQKGAPYQRLAVFVLEQPSSVPDLNAANGQTTAADTKEDASAAPGSPTPTPKPSAPISSIPIPEHLPIAALKADPRYSTRENFILRSLVTKYRLKPIGVDMFRTVWDETTAGMMRRNGIVGADVEFKRKRVDPLPYKRLKAERYR